MRIAILADAHSNLPALEAVIEDSRDRGVEATWHLGDAIGYGAEPSGCLQMLADLDALLIYGNHEDAVLNPCIANRFNPAAEAAITWTRDNLSVESLDFISSLPVDAVPMPGVHLFHGLPGKPSAYLRTMVAAEAVFHELAAADPRMKLAFFGHTHRRAAYTTLSGVATKALGTDGDIILARGRKYLFNPGSVGQPRNGDPRAQYLIYDRTKGSVEFLQTEYDVRRAQSRIIASGLPHSLAARLAQGM